MAIQTMTGSQYFRNFLNFGTRDETPFCDAPQPDFRTGSVLNWWGERPREPLKPKAHVGSQ